MKLLFLFFILTFHFINASPLEWIKDGVDGSARLIEHETSQYTEVIVHNNHKLGSATRLCLNNKSPLTDRPWFYTLHDQKLNIMWKKLPVGRDWLITAQHVVNDLKKVETLSKLKYEVVFADPDTDLALLSRPETSKVVDCLHLAEVARLPMVFDAQTLIQKNKVEVSVEAWNSIENKILRKRFSTFVGASYLPGTERRVRTGSLVVSVLEGLKGFSGGALIAKPDPLGELANGQRQDEELIVANPKYERLLGMILSTRESGNEVSALSFRRIRDRILEHFENPSKTPIISYLDNNINKNDDYEVGSGEHGDSGSGEHGDSGSGEHGDAGNNKSKEARKKWLFVRNNDRIWSEFEALTPVLKNTEYGIYTKNGKLFSTLKSLNDFQWVSFKDIFDTEVFDLNSQLGFGDPFQFTQHKSSNSKSFLSLLRESKERKLKATNLVLEEEKSQNANSLIISIYKPQSEKAFIKVKIQLSYVDTQKNSTERELELIADYEIADQKGTLTSSGSLRRLQSKDIDLLIERSSGIQILFGKNLSNRISGPTVVTPLYPLHPIFMQEL